MSTATQALPAGRKSGRLSCNPASVLRRGYLLFRWSMFICSLKRCICSIERFGSLIGPEPNEHSDAGAARRTKIRKTFVQSGLNFTQRLSAFQVVYIYLFVETLYLFNRTFRFTHWPGANEHSDAGAARRVKARKAFVQSGPAVYTRASWFQVALFIPHLLNRTLRLARSRSIARSQ